MKIRTKLIALLLAISLIPGAIVGVAGVQNMQEIGSFAEEESGDQLESQITGELNTTVSARQEEIHNLLSAREVDAHSVAESAAVQKYHAANQGQMELVQRQSQNQLGYMALQMHDSIDNTKQQVLDEQYDGRDWDDLSASEQRAVKSEVERIMVGTAGNGTDPAGSFYDQFQPGYISDTGYFYFTDLDSNIVVHHSIEDGRNLVDDIGGTLTVFRDIKTNIQESPEIQQGESWGVAEYDWQDTTQEGNPTEEKFISYTYHEEFDWIIAPNVYYYELQTTAVNDAEDEIQTSFESYLQTRTITVNDEEHFAYEQITLVDSTGQGMIQTTRTDSGDVKSSSISEQSFQDQEWFDTSQSLEKGEVYFGDVRTVEGQQVMRVISPVYYDGEYVGAISLLFNYDVISTVTNGVTVGDSGHLSIVNGDGRVISHPDSTVVEGDSNIGDSAYSGELSSIAEASILPGETGLATYSNSEDSYYVAYAPIDVGQKQLRLLATVPEEDVTGPVAALGAAMSERTASARNFFLLLFGGITLAIVAIGLKISSYIADPIQDVRDRALSLTDGDLAIEMEESSRGDEIGDLHNAFAEMQANLQAVFQDLDELSRDLQAGELDQDLETGYPGTYGNIMENLDEGSQQLTGSFNEIRAASNNLRVGQLEQAIDVERPGEYGAVLEDLQAGANQLSESFTQISQASEGLKRGHLNQDLDTDLPGVYGRVMTNLDEGFEDLEASIAQVQAIADTVANTSEEVAASTEEIETASQEVAGSVQEISQGADEQSGNMQEAANELNDLSATVEEIASSASQVEENAGEAVDRGETGRQSASEATSEITQIEEEAEEAVEQVANLDREMEQIGEIVQMINDIAEQTNLLALNASIEAARAGEAGEGFAVVADEIKTLAGEAGDATAEIEERIEEVQRSTSETVEGIEEMKESVESGAETIERTIQMFDDIAGSINEVEDGVKEISDATDDQATSTEEVVAMVDEVSSVAEETAAEASNVSAAAEEQTASLTDMGENVENLSQVAEELHQLMAEFDVGQTAGNRGMNEADFQQVTAANGGSDDSRDVS